MVDCIADIHILECMNNEIQYGKLCNPVNHIIKKKNCIHNFNIDGNFTLIFTSTVGSLLTGYYGTGPQA